MQYRPPAERSDGGVTVRNDTGVYEGGEISLFYDPMIAKLVTHAPTREAAIDAQADALDAFTIEGIRHNVPFLAALMQHPRWRAGELSTGFIAEEFPDGFQRQARRRDGARDGAGRRRDRSRARRAQAQHLRPAGRQQRHPRAAPRVRLGEGDHPLDVDREGDAIVGAIPTARWQVGTGRPCSLPPGSPATCCGRGTIDDRPVSVHVRPVPNGFELAHRGIEAQAYVFTEREADAGRQMPGTRRPTPARRCAARCPGLVVSIAVDEGQEVKAGETLAIVEAMKMENVLRAERDGVVKKIRAKPGDSLAVDAVIMEFE